MRNMFTHVRIVGLYVCLLILCLNIQAWAASRITVPSKVTVSGPYILIKDVFHNIPNKNLAQKTLTNAPDPGKSIALNLGWLSQIATLNGIDWQPKDPHQQVIVTRAGQKISKEEITQYINNAFKKRLQINELQNNTYRFVITPSNLEDVYVPITASKEIYVKTFNYDKIQKKFSITFSVPNAPLKNNTIGPIVGKAVKLLPCVVPTGRIMPGDVINKDDLKVIWVESNLAQINNASSIDQVIGKTPKSPLADGKPINLNQLQKPLLVKRGQLITIFYKTPGMQLSVTGKAMQSGSKNDIIRVMNTNSSKIINAIVTGPQAVTIKAIP